MNACRRVPPVLRLAGFAPLLTPGRGFARRYGVALGLVWFLAIAARAPGHEGHQPLPTKGVEVHLNEGRITLSRAARDVLDVRSVRVRERPVEGVIRAYATALTPWNRRALVTSRLAGRISRLLVRAGDVVEAGQVLAELDSLDLQTLRLDYQMAENDLQLSGRILETLNPAAKAGSIPGQRLFEAESAHRQNQNSLDILRAKAFGLKVPEERLQQGPDEADLPLRLQIVSPIAGVIDHADVAVGKYVEPTEHLFDVIDTSQVWVKIGVLERDLHRVTEGQRVRLTFHGLPGQTFETRVDKLGVLLDPQTHQGTAWSEIANPENGPKLLPGMNGQAELILPSTPGHSRVPAAAVFSDGAERYVLREETWTREGSEYRKLPVVIGRQTRDAVEVLSGNLYPGDRVVTQGGHELSNLLFSEVLRLTPETAGHIGLELAEVTEQCVEVIRQFDGALDIPPQSRTTASSQLGGTLIAIKVDRGASVKAGDVLAEIASLELQDIQLELLRAHLGLDLWRETLTRLRNAGDSVPRRTLLEMESRVRGLETQVDNVRRQLLTLGLSASQIDGIVATRQVVDALPLKAPLDGVVVHFDRTLGQVVRADEPLFEIHDPSRVWVQAFVGERDSTRVAVGQGARIRLVAHPDFAAEGRVARIGPIVGVDSRTQAAWIEFNEPPRAGLQHNMLARVALTVDRPPPTLAVPRSAVVRDGLRNFVFVATAAGTFERRRVELGRSDDRYLEVQRGLVPGERIAVRGVPQIQTAHSAVR